MKTAMLTGVVVVLAAGGVTAQPPAPAPAPVAAPPPPVAPSPKGDEQTPERVPSRIPATNKPAAPARAGKIDVALEARIKPWPWLARSAVVTTHARYGAPAEASDSLVIWNQVGPWKQVIVHRAAAEHQFPAAHQDVLEQVIALAVPADKFDDLAAFDGSVTAHRTRGELSAACDVEAMNFLALNLAHDIITDQRTVAEARAMLAKTAAAYRRGARDPMTLRLTFELPTGPTADPDQATGQVTQR